jgi:hypothetical protein
VRLDLFKSKDTVDELRRFVERGGGLVTNHALVGVRGFLPPIPEVATGGKQVEGGTWKATGYHAVTRTLDRRQTYTSTFPDRISVEVGRQGRVIASTPEGDPIVVIGHYGRGRYMACGLGMGIGKGDGDAPVSEAEAKLLVGAIPWLVRK